MSFGASAPPVELEGDYSDWIIYDSFDDADVDTGFGFENGAFFNLEETVILLVDAANAVKKYDIATKTLGSSLFTPYYSTGLNFAMNLTRSAYGTYVVWIDDAFDNIYVMKDGAVIKTMSYADLGLNDGRVKGVCVSSMGKYIAVYGERSVTGNHGWVVLEGS